MTEFDFHKCQCSNKTSEAERRSRPTCTKSSGSAMVEMGKIRTRRAVMVKRIVGGICWGSFEYPSCPFIQNKSARCVELSPRDAIQF